MLRQYTAGRIESATVASGDNHRSASEVQTVSYISDLNAEITKLSETVCIVVEDMFDVNRGCEGRFCD